MLNFRARKTSHLHSFLDATFGKLFNYVVSFVREGFGKEAQVARTNAMRFVLFLIVMSSRTVRFRYIIFFVVHMIVTCILCVFFRTFYIFWS